jgi:FKBP-type peptidyl-prolyl cis-trans isomerase
MAMEIGSSMGAPMGGVAQAEGKAGEAAGANDFFENFHKLPDSRFKQSPSGLRVAVMTEGHGAAAAKGAMVKVRYTGWLPDGTKFDSSEEKGQPIELKLGTGQVIQGWEEALTGMKPGEKRQIVIPPNLAYGGRQVGTIPANSTLIFNIELESVGSLPHNPKGTMSVMA